MNAWRKWFVGGVVAISSAIASADWPAYRGPNGDGISTEKMLASWPAGGPRQLWKIRVGEGIGSFAIKEDRAYYLAGSGSDELCHAIDMKTGQELWKTPLGRTFTGRSSGQGGNGPCSTPVVSGDKVYIYGSVLKLFCLNAADGKVIWQHDIQREYDGQAESSSAISRWGSSCSPVVVDDLVIIQGGGRGQTYLAFHKDTGALAWKRETETLTQSTPVVATIADVRQVIFLQQSGLVSIEPKTGATLWKQPYSDATAIAASPVVAGDIVYCSIGYNVGGGAFQVSKQGNRWSVRQLWRTRGQSMNWWSTPVVKDGYLYGIHGRGDDKNAPLQCIDLKTGKLMWSGPPAGGGEILVVDGKLIVQAGTGKLHLVDPSPNGYKEISSAQPLSGQAWGWPAFSRGILVYRTTTEAIALDLSSQ